MIAEDVDQSKYHHKSHRRNQLYRHAFAQDPLHIELLFNPCENGLSRTSFRSVSGLQFSFKGVLTHLPFFSATLNFALLALGLAAISASSATSAPLVKIGRASCRERAETSA